MWDLLNSQRQHIHYFQPYYFDLKPSYFNTKPQIIPNQKSNIQYLRMSVKWLFITKAVFSKCGSWTFLHSLHQEGNKKDATNYI